MPHDPISHLLPKVQIKENADDVILPDRKEATIVSSASFERLTPSKSFSSETAADLNQSVRSSWSTNTMKPATQIQLIEYQGNSLLLHSSLLIIYTQLQRNQNTVISFFEK